MNDTPVIPVDLRDDGVLWLVNRVVFHPRGFALGVNPESGDLFLHGDGCEPWRFASQADVEADGGDPEKAIDEDEAFAQIEALLDRARQENAP